MKLNQLKHVKTSQKKGQSGTPDLLSCLNFASLVVQKCWSSVKVLGSESLDIACRVEIQDGRRWTTDRKSWTNASISYRNKVNSSHRRNLLLQKVTRRKWQVKMSKCYRNRMKRALEYKPKFSKMVILHFVHTMKRVI